MRKIVENSYKKKDKLIISYRTIQDAFADIL